MLTRAAARAVLAVHRPAPAPNAFDNPDYRCRQCGTAWPCRARIAAESLVGRPESRGWVVAVTAVIVLSGLLLWVVR